MSCVVWFRRDLRLGDNPAWAEGTHAESVCPLFVVDPGLYDRVTPRRRSALVAGLAALDASLLERGGRLRIEVGDPVDVVPAVAASVGGGRIHLNGEVTPYGRRRDARVAERVPVTVHHGHYVHGPGMVRTAAGNPYRVFTAYHRAWTKTPVVPAETAGSAAVTADPGAGIPPAPPPPQPMGEAAALARLERFMEENAAGYRRHRDRPDLDATSRVSVDLKYGTLGAQTAHRAALAVGADAFLRQLAWRDFFAQVLAAAPETVDAPMRGDLAGLRWADDPGDIAAWKTGQTGYPLVDAGMRQLAAEGWVHNRVRMVVASFLVKDLLVDWRVGERFFRRHLLDADVAQNVGNWQWVAGTGTDAAPYFRVLNPVTQSKRFDPDGTYIRRWVPELERLAAPAVHAPWLADPAELGAAGVVLGRTYPEPLVDHAEARERALAAYAQARDERSAGR